MTLRLRARLMIVIGALAIASVAAVAFSARFGTRQEFERFQNLERVRAIEDDQARASLARVARALQGVCCAPDRLDAAAAELAAGEILLVFDAAGALKTAIAAGRSPANIKATFVQDELRITVSSSAASVTSGVVMALKGVPHAAVTFADGSAGSLHVVRLPADDAAPPAATFLGSIDRTLLVAGALVAILALAAAWFVAAEVTGPIAELNRATRDLARGDLSRRVPVVGRARKRDEVGELATSFNQMAAELERQQTLRRHLMHDVAHELRTPLTALRCRLETIIDGLSSDPRPALRQANDDVAHLSQLVTDLDDLARAEAGELALTIATVRLADVVRSAVRLTGLDGDARLAVNVDHRLSIRADALRARQMILNLLSNADRHTPAGHTISVAADAAGSSVVLTVRNTGSALTPEQLARVFDRFYRADPARPRETGGSGLGLAIVKHLAEAQGARVAGASDGASVTFTVTFPAAE